MDQSNQWQPHTQCIGEVTFWYKSQVLARDLYALTIVSVEIVNMFPDIGVVISGLNCHPGSFAAMVCQHSVISPDLQYDHFII